MKPLAIALALAALAPAPQEQKSLYAFPKDEVQRYEVDGDLKISLAGSHADLILDGNATPLRLEYKALFENVVVQAPEPGGTAKLQRRVKWLKASGTLKGEEIKIDFDADREEAKRFKEAKGETQMVNWLKGWCLDPPTFEVEAHGKVLYNPNQLVNKAGMMYWQVKPDAVAWTTHEKIAVPLFHNKILLNFQNSAKTFERGGKKFLKITGKPEMAGSEAPPEGLVAEATGEITFKASGKADVEIDLAKGCMTSMKLEVRVELSGTAQIANGKPGPLAGSVTLTETQTLREK
jgi:hypothetical protein